MSGLFQSLSIARRAIWASRLGIEVASHNVANVNTQGYSRQRISLTTPFPLVTPQGQLGQGVQVSGIHRMRNELLDVQYRQASTAFAFNDVRGNIYAQVETVILEPSDAGIGTLMTEFFNEFSNLGSEPDNTAYRNTLVQKAKDLAGTFRSKHQSLNQIYGSLQSEIGAMTTQVNQILEEIADLNRQIAVHEGGVSSSNDLRDRRDLLVDQLSDYVNISYSEDSRGSLTITTGGHLLVSDSVNRGLSLETSDDTGEMELSIADSNNRTVKLSNGRLAGLLEMRNESIPKLIDQLDTLASTFIEEVNHIHSYGFGLPVGTPAVAQTGLDFFDGANAATIQVSSEIEDNPSNIAASLDGSAGNGDVAFALANLRDQKFFNGGTQTFSDFYGSIVSELGTEIQLAESGRQNQDLLKLQIENQRISESGVSLDDEMTDLIRYQRSLEAASRVISVVDEALSTLINM